MNYTVYFRDNSYIEFRDNGANCYVGNIANNFGHIIHRHNITSDQFYKTLGLESMKELVSNIIEITK